MCGDAITCMGPITDLNMYCIVKRVKHFYEQCITCNFHIDSMKISVCTYEVRVCTVRASVGSISQDAAMLSYHLQTLKNIYWLRVSVVYTNAQIFTILQILNMQIKTNIRKILLIVFFNFPGTTFPPTKISSSNGQILLLMEKYHTSICMYKCQMLELCQLSHTTGCGFVLFTW